MKFMELQHGVPARNRPLADLAAGRTGLPSRISSPILSRSYRSADFFDHTTIGRAPKYLVTDSGVQFTAIDFKRWCRRHGIRPRRGAIGKRGSIAVLERFIGTLKRDGLQLLAAVPLLRRAFHREVKLLFDWYNRFRPHTTLKGATPDEVYFKRRPACHLPRFEPRLDWPRRSRSALPQVLVKGQPGAALNARVEFLAGRRHLPVITVRRAA